MRLLLLIIFSIILSTTTFSQSKRKLLRDAFYYYDYNNFTKALDLFYKIIEKDSTNSEVNYSIGRSIFYTENDKTKAIKYLQQSENVESVFYLAQIAHLNKNFEFAITLYEKYLNSSQKKQFSDDEIIFFLNKSYVAQRLMSNPIDVKLRNLGENINSDYPDYLPIISADENTMYFTSRREGGVGNLLDPTGKYYEDIYVSYYKNGVWTKAGNIGSPINTSTHESCIGISADGRKMFIYRTNAQGTGGGIYESIFDDTTWTSPKFIEAEFNNIKAKEKTVSLVPTADSSIFYFVSDRAGGYGGTDIYKIVRFGDGSWSLPQNLGSDINTPYDEDAPFYNYFNNKLYFSSKGHENMGDYDIFVSTLKDDNKWSKPQNLGYPINTVGGDRFLTVSGDNRRGYYSRPKEEGSSDYDIFVVEIPDNPNPYIYLTGYVVDNNNDCIAEAELIVKEVENPQLYSIYRPNRQTSRFVMVLKPGIEYELLVSYENKKMQRRLFYPVDIRNTEILIDFIIE